MINDLDCVAMQIKRVYLPSTSAYFVYLNMNPRSHRSRSGLRPPADKQLRAPPFILSAEAWLSPRPICLLILLGAERKSMERDAFGGPFTCQITHQSVGFGYWGAVTGTVPERAP